MSDCLNVGALQSPGGLRGVAARLEWLARQLRGMPASGVDLLVLPELFLTGYSIGERLLDGVESAALESLSALARAHGVALVAGYPEKTADGVYNAACCIDVSGDVIANQRKLLLPPGFEQTCFSRGAEYAVCAIGGFTVGMLICYDAEFPENFRRLASGGGVSAERGADLIVCPTALSAEWGVVAEKVIPARAFENGVFICYANHCGEENGIDYYGGSCIVAPNGDDLARAGGEAGLITASLQKDAVAKARARLPYHEDRKRLPAG